MGYSSDQARFSSVNYVSIQLALDITSQQKYSHSIIGGVIGSGIALIGADAISWGWNNKGVAQVISAWFIAPAIAGGFAAIIFLITEYGVLRRKRPLHVGIIMIPIYFGVTSGILTMLIVWKGGAISSCTMYMLIC
jgi:hypothetical protein